MSTLKWPTFDLPWSLQNILVMDYHLAKNGIKCGNPAKCPIDTIVDDYIKETSTIVLHPKMSLYEATAGSLKDYINNKLGELLYPIEKPDYKEVYEQQTVSKSVGIVHLLRLLAQFPKFVVLSNFKQREYDIVVEGIKHFIEYLNRHWENYYWGAEDYENVSEERFWEVVESFAN